MTTKTEVRDKTSQDIDPIFREALPRTLDNPQENTETRNINIDRNPPYGQLEIIIPSKRAEISKNIERNKSSISRGNEQAFQQLQILLRKTPEKNWKKKPKEQSVVPNIFPKYKGVGTHILKQKFHNWADANHAGQIRTNIEGEVASPNNPEKVSAGKRKTTYSGCLRDASNSD